MLVDDRVELLVEATEAEQVEPRDRGDHLVVDAAQSVNAVLAEAPARPARWRTLEHTPDTIILVEEARVGRGARRHSAGRSRAPEPPAASPPHRTGAGDAELAGQGVDHGAVARPVRAAQDALAYRLMNTLLLR